MTTRLVKITASHAVEYTHATHIDEADYIGWLAGGDDTDDAMREYIDAGRDALDVIVGVIADGTPGFEDSVLVSVVRVVDGSEVRK